MINLEKTNTQSVVTNWLLARGFALEQGGGGCQVLSRYSKDGGFVWVTCSNGGGLPEQSDWMLCVYGQDIGDIRFEARCESIRLGLGRAVEIACAIADGLIVEASIND